jgi:hypothetical protein
MEEMKLTKIKIMAASTLDSKFNGLFGLLCIIIILLFRLDLDHREKANRLMLLYREPLLFSFFDFESES